MCGDSGVLLHTCQHVTENVPKALLLGYIIFSQAREFINIESISDDCYFYGSLVKIIM